MRQSTVSRSGRASSYKPGCAILRHHNDRRWGRHSANTGRSAFARRPGAAASSPRWRRTPDFNQAARVMIGATTSPFKRAPAGLEPGHASPARAALGPHAATPTLEQQPDGLLPSGESPLTTPGLWANPPSPPLRPRILRQVVPPARPRPPARAASPEKPTRRPSRRCARPYRRLTSPRSRPRRHHSPHRCRPFSEPAPSVPAACRGPAA